MIDTLASGENYYPQRFDIIDESNVDAIIEREKNNRKWYLFEGGQEWGGRSEQREYQENQGREEGQEDKQEDEFLEESDYGNVSIITPHLNAFVGANVLVTGYYDKGRIEKIVVNGKQAILDSDDEMWEVKIAMASGEKEIEVISYDMEEKKRLVEKRLVKVDGEAPSVPDIIAPDLDENNRAEILGESVVITGRAHSDIAQIFVTADSHSPYRLKKYSPGDDLFYYKASKEIGNFHEGSNIYTLQFFDEFGNISTITITLEAAESDTPGDDSGQTAESDTSDDDKLKTSKEETSL